MLVGDALVVLLHVFVGYRTVFFNLDNELNLPTFYQGVKLVMIGTLLLLTIRRVRRWRIFAPLGALLFYLGFDEMMQIHERFGGWLRSGWPAAATSLESMAATFNYDSSRWVMYLSPFIGVVLVYALWLTVHRISNRQLVPLAGGFLFFLLVIVFEVIDSMDGHSWYTYQVLMTAEETFEMLGASLFGYFTLLLIDDKKKIEA